MPISTFDLFSVGIGPSSSHTVGPMRAARTFAVGLADDRQLGDTVRVRAELYGSLGATGRGHGSDIAIVLGLMGESPEAVDIRSARPRAQKSLASGEIALLELQTAKLTADDLVFQRRETLSYHPNGMRLTAWAKSGRILRERIYYSIGGGFVVDAAADGSVQVVPDETPVAYPFHTAAELCEHCDREHIQISDVMYANELAWRKPREIEEGLDRIWETMQSCVAEGLSTRGVLPGFLKVPRRAPDLYDSLSGDVSRSDPLLVMDWVNVYAIAVNEQNAAGDRVVTAPTNGAAGVIPAVLHYYWNFVPGATVEGVRKLLLAAGAIGALYKQNASISGAEVGCQGEVGSACSMAAGGLCEVLGGTPAQAENAAEIAMEHNLGLTCDPVGGLVQVPCIERNAMAAIKAINAARIALKGNGQHLVSLDNVIKTMKQTGADMKVKYKETSRGGLAVNVVEC